jgi:ribonuclease HI
MPCIKVERPVCTIPGIYHVVFSDRYSLIFHSRCRPDCEREVKGFSGAKYKRFDTRPEAEAYVDSGVIPRVNSAAQSVPSSFIYLRQSTTYATGNFERQSPSKPRKASPDIGCESGHDVVYCRGTCKGNGTENAIAGIGIWWVPDDSR